MMPGNEYAVTDTLCLSQNQRTNCENRACEYRFEVRASMTQRKAFDSRGHAPKFDAILPSCTQTPPPPPGPDFSLSVTPILDTVSWGDTATYAVSLSGANGFAGTINVDAATTGRNALPAGSSASAPPVTLNASTNPVSTTLSLATQTAATAPGTSSFRITATSGSITKSANTSVTVQRTPGYFTDIAPLDSGPRKTCGTITATVIAGGQGPAIRFEGPWGRETVLSTGFYDISPNCRVGLVDLPRPNNQPIRISVRNLAFSSATGATNLGGQIVNPAVAATNICFSPDDSILFMIYPGGSGTNQAALASAWDMTTGSLLGTSGGFTGVVPCARRSGINPLNPNGVYGVRIDGNKLVAEGFISGNVPNAGNPIRFEFTIP
jgi:hypothetical protein